MIEKQGGKNELWNWYFSRHFSRYLVEKINKRREQMKKALFILFLLLAVFVCAKSCEYRYQKMEQYEIENNCKYDYNDLCYTKEQKPWLFK